ncbi:hypothetical protein [Candidatus Avelusimicrobium fimicolum]|uniref:hypothetical protein n=1 Tax=Candidatus Avelusimicrobium fimicolum TaxID=3416216 RepID=UPI003D0E38DC
MTLNYKESESMERPAEVDETSSSFVVYLRKDITEVQVPATNDTPAHVKYVYQEAILSKADYERYKWAKEIAAEVVAALKGA